MIGVCLYYQPWLRDVLCFLKVRSQVEGVIVGMTADVINDRARTELVLVRTMCSVGLLTDAPLSAVMSVDSIPDDRHCKGFHEIHPLLVQHSDLLQKDSTSIRCTPTALVVHQQSILYPSVGQLFLGW